MPAIEQINIANQKEPFITRDGLTESVPLIKWLEDLKLSKILSINIKYIPSKDLGKKYAKGATTVSSAAFKKNIKRRNESKFLIRNSSNSFLNIFLLNLFFLISRMLQKIRPT